MKLQLLAALAILSLSTVACSKNECEMKTDAEKQAFGTLADMTQGAFNCGIEGVSVKKEDAMIMTPCAVGSDKCVPAMFAIHAKPATIKDIAASYKAFLEKNQWKVEEKATSGKLGNGKPYEGVQLGAKNADKALTVKISPMGEDMVEARTYLIAMP